MEFLKSGSIEANYNAEMTSIQSNIINLTPPPRFMRCLSIARTNKK